MRLRIEATAEELQQKGQQLVKSLAQHLYEHNPELAESLEKAVIRKELSLKYPVLRQLHEKTAGAYDKTLDAMVDDIDRALRDQEPKALRKAERGDPQVLSQRDTIATLDGYVEKFTGLQPRYPSTGYVKSEFGEPPEPAEPADTGPKEDVDPDFDPESGDPIFDPKTGLTPTETAEAKEKGELDEDEEEETTEKGVAHMHDHTHDQVTPEPVDEPEDEEPLETPLRQPVKPGKPDDLDKAGFKDHTLAIAQKDERLYEQAKAAVQDWDHTAQDRDFEQHTGRFYGMSTNELINWLREKRA